ncbi:MULTISPECIES: prolyl oligopeptidase family serine peptidase [unclassified Rhizobium]|uniref:alpha/beta hydrolase family protein n=1 Tax=unclassified Rhizobium TaxID=2613769 RepID=UPI000EA916F3|nr:MULTISPECIES: prolyl oligopeptidase family serine peptidase [unclassified Rhizobium]AYG68826.1 dienelactone hydrolase [Rhizobium sp. CCGE531]AYG75212.1 dienelactone hydrolase [Rhizobium sp. CCGE532]
MKALETAPVQNGLLHYSTALALSIFRLWWRIAALLIIGLSGAAHAKDYAFVAFQEVAVPNGSEPSLRAGIWYPTLAKPQEARLATFTQLVAPDGAITGRRLPLIVISHGGGGSLAGHYDAALALAHAGFVVAAVDHAGDTFDDQRQVLKLWRRPQQLSRLITFVLDEWRDHAHVDSRRIGAFGFSNGGFTVLVSAGGKPDLSLIDPYCVDHPAHDLCSALRQAGVASVAALPVPSDAWQQDGRIKAVAVAAPAFGFTFSPGGLRDVKVPIQLWRAADDRHQPNPWYDEAVRAALPRPPELHVVTGAGHYDFLPPCSATLAKSAPLICTDPNGFDRATFHRRMNAQLIRFFRAKLR